MGGRRLQKQQELKTDGEIINVGFYLEFIKTVFQVTDSQGKLRNRIVAFTSATPGEGVSHVVDLVAKELAAQTQNRVVRVDASALHNLHLADANQISRHCEETEIDNLVTLSAPRKQLFRLRAAVQEWPATGIPFPSTAPNA